MSKSKKQSRKSLGEEFWKKHIKYCQKNKLNQVQYCKDNNLKQSTFYKWLKRLSSSCTLKKKEVSFSRADFIEVAPITSTHYQSQHTNSSYLEVEIQKGCKIKIPADWDLENLRKILVLVKEVVCL
jgi:hypothetical protein